MGNANLTKAKKEKNDEFYTQYNDIQKEVNAYIEYNPDVFRDKIILLPCDDPEWSNFTKFFASNFERYGIKKLISTSYAFDSKHIKGEHKVSLFEEESPQYDSSKTSSHGKIFTLERDKDESGRINVDDLEWKYLEGDGDFRSEEVTKLRDEADIIITNPPFSLFRQFLKWILDGDKQFLIIGNKNFVATKEMFPLIKENKIWSGATTWGSMTFEAKNNEEYDVLINGIPMKSIPAVWFTNIEHGRRHKPLKLMTRVDNIKFSKHKEIREKGYQKYDNYNAIEVPYVNAIPSDYDGVMGVPISFLNSYCPEQFEILGAIAGWNDISDLITKEYPSRQIQTDKNGESKTVIKLNDGIPLISYDTPPLDEVYYTIGDNKYYTRSYSRIFIRRKTQ